MTTHLGSGITLAPELLLREVLLLGVHELAGDRSRQDLLIGRFDLGQEKRTETWDQEMRAALRALPERIQCAVGYPQDVAQAPYWSVVLDSSAEDDGSAVAGDVQDRRWVRRGDKAELIERLGIEERASVQIGCWATSPEEALLLSAAAREILFRDKNRLAAAGILEVSFSEGGDQPNPDLYPWTGYVPVIRCSLHWTRRQDRSRGLYPTSIAVTLTFSN